MPFAARCEVIHYIYTVQLCDCQTMTTLNLHKKKKRPRSCVNRLHWPDKHAKPINQVLLTFSLHTWNEQPFPIVRSFCLQLHYLQSTTPSPPPPPPPPTGTFWYKQALLSWLIKTAWTSGCMQGQRESEQPAYLPGSPSFERHRALHYQDWVHLSLWWVLHMNTNGLLYSLLFFSVRVTDVRYEKHTCSGDSILQNEMEGKQQQKGYMISNNNAILHLCF